MICRKSYRSLVTCNYFILPTRRHIGCNPAGRSTRLCPRCEQKWARENQRQRRTHLICFSSRANCFAKLSFDFAICTSFNISKILMSIMTLDDCAFQTSFVPHSCRWLVNRFAIETKVCFTEIGSYLRSRSECLLPAYINSFKWCPDG